MKRAFTILIPILSAVYPLVRADSIQIEHGRIPVFIDRGETPFKIGGASFRKASEAAEFLDYLAKNWPNQPRPTVVVEYMDKALPDDWELFEAALSRMAMGAHWKIVRMPMPRGAIPDSWLTLSKLHKKWAEQGGAGEPATRSESDLEGGDKPQPEAEGRSR